MLSLLEIMISANWASENFVPAGSTWSTPLGRLVRFASRATGWSQDAVPRFTACATAPRTNSLNMDPSGLAVVGEIVRSGVHAPLGDSVAASKPTSDASVDSFASSAFHEVGGAGSAGEG